MVADDRGFVDNGKRQFTASQPYSAVQCIYQRVAGFPGSPLYYIDDLRDARLHLTEDVIAANRKREVPQETLSSRKYLSS
jgi:hypothetical protein